MSSQTPRNVDGTQVDSPAPDAGRGTDDRAEGVQGEGDYASARRYQADTERFIKDGKVADAAKSARPRDAQEEKSMAQAEEAGREHSHGEDEHDGFAQGAKNRERHQ